MKFVADGMLGKLSRWLRMLGCDVEYFNNMDDEELVKVASKEKRVLLTRDFQLFRKASARGCGAILVEGETEVERLARLAERLSIRLEIDANMSRCPKCNTQISSIPKGEVENRVPASTFEFYDDFWICPKCNQVYWQGSHWTKISSTLSQARQELEQLMNQKKGGSSVIPQVR